MTNLISRPATPVASVPVPSNTLPAGAVIGQAIGDAGSYSSVKDTWFTARQFPSSVEDGVSIEYYDTPSFGSVAVAVETASTNRSYGGDQYIALRLLLVEQSNRDVLRELTALRAAVDELASASRDSSRARQLDADIYSNEDASRLDAISQGVEKPKENDEAFARAALVSKDPTVRAAAAAALPAIIGVASLPLLWKALEVEAQPYAKAALEAAIELAEL